MINAGEPVMVCPYNKAHSIIQSRMQFHLAKCRLQHPKSEKVACPFNSTHIVPKVELEFHETICGNRYLLDSFVYEIGNTKCPVEPVPMNAPAEELAPDGEDWDAEPACPPVLATVQMTLENKPVFVNKVGASKSVRKAHRQQERLRYQRVIEDESLKKKMSSDSGDSSTSSSLATKGKSTLEDPNVPSCSSATKKQLSSEDPNVSSTSTSKKIPAKEEQKEKNDNNDDFEVVSYKKNQGKKNQARQTQLGIRYPPSINTKKGVEDRESVVSQMSQMKINSTSKKITANETQLNSGFSQRASFASSAPTGNAWDRSLNLGERQNSSGSHPLGIEDFPSLPVSGRGRGLFLVNRSVC